MKKSLLVILFSVSLRLFAQTNVYHPFPDSNAIWNQESVYLVQNTPVSEPQKFFYSGDTVIATFTYKRVLTTGYRYYLIPSNGCCYYYNQPHGFIRQDSTQKKIYYFDSKDTLLYDFDLKVGDTLPPTYTNNPSIGNYVSSIDSILIGSTYRKQFHISVLGSTSVVDSNYVQLIEGIGSTFGLLWPLDPPFEAGSVLKCFLQGAAILANKKS
jgi:hypothetical protein